MVRRPDKPFVFAAEWFVRLINKLLPPPCDAARIRQPLTPNEILPAYNVIRALD
jgi:hypothetical protein